VPLQSGKREAIKIAHIGWRMSIWPSLMKSRKKVRKETEEKREKERKLISPTAEQLRRYQGDYWRRGIGCRITGWELWTASLKIMALLDAMGTAHNGNLPTNAFEATSTDNFEVNEEQITIHFERDQHEGVNGFTLDAGRTRGMIFTRKDSSRKQEAR